MVGFLAVASAAPDGPTDDLVSASAAVLELYKAGRYEEAYERAVVLERQASKRKRQDVDRLRAEVRLADALVGVNRFGEAAALYETLFERIDITTIEHFVLAVEMASGAGAAHQYAGDLDTSLAWHEAGWRLLTENQVFHPIRFVAAAQYADTAVARSDFALAKTLREWIVASMVNESASANDVAAAKLGLSDVLLRSGDFDAAAGLLSEVLEVVDVDGHPHRVMALSRAGDVAIQQGLLRDARRWIERAHRLNVAQFGPGHPRIYESLSSMASLASLEGRHREALDLQKELVNLLVEVRGATHYATSHQRQALAQAHLELLEVDEAREQLELAAESFQTLPPNHPENVELARGRIAVEMADGRLSVARQELERVLPLLDAEPAMAPVRPGTRSRYAFVLASLGELDEADVQYARSLQDAEEVLGKGHPETASILNAYAALLLERGRYADAEVWFRRALMSVEDALGPEHARTIPMLNNLALARQEQGDWVEAATLLERGIEVSAKTYGEQHEDTASEMMNLGRLLMARGDLSGAERWLSRASELREDALAQDGVEALRLRMNLAALDVARGELDAGREQFMRALRTAETLGESHPDVVAPLDNLVTLDLMEGRLDDAEQRLIRANRIRETNSNTDDRALAASKLRRIHLMVERGNEREAYQALQELDSWLPTTIGPTERVRLAVKSSLASVAFRVGEFDEARDRIAEVIDLEEEGLSVVMGTLSERERLALAGAYRSNLYEMLWIHGQEGGDPEAAYGAWLRFRGIASRSLAVERPALLARTDPETYRRYRDVRDALAAMSSDATVNVERVQQLTDEKESLRRTLAVAAQKERATVEQTSPMELCRQLPANTVLVDFVRRRATGVTVEGVAYDDVVSAFVLDSTCTLRRTELGPAPAIDAAIARHQALLSSGSTSSRIDRQGKKVRKLVWDPLGIDDTATSVFIVPDGSIATTSFATLPKDGAPLLTRHTFRFLDNALEARGREPAVDRGALVVGDVDYGDPGGERGLCIPDFPPLPSTKTEASMVAEHVGGTVLSGRAVTPNALVDGLSGASSVHLATHGYFSGACRAQQAGGVDSLGALNPLVMSGLALSNANQDSSAIWTAESISTLPMGHVDLVVLSACETGLGTLESGEGVMGMRRAFGLAGARATVMSLWPVPDSATQRLMDAFYRALAVHPSRDEAAALRTAQLELYEASLADNGVSDPGSWGAFVVGGAPRRDP